VTGKHEVQRFPTPEVASCLGSGERGGRAGAGLRPGDVVIWDDPDPHWAEEVIDAVDVPGARVVPLPP